MRTASKASAERATAFFSKAAWLGLITLLFFMCNPVYAATQWSSDQAYTAGTQVEYNGTLYEAKWWSRGYRPDTAVENEWDSPWKLVSGDTGGNSGGEDPVETEDPPETNNPVVYPDYSAVDAGKGIEWPEQVFAPFVDATAWPAYQIAQESAKSMVPYYNLGFVVSKSATVCEPTWGTYYNAAECPLTSQIKAMRAAGGDVIVSFGGAANVPLHVAAPDAETLKEQYKRFIKAYGLTRIDFDIEGNWVEDKASLIRNSKALKMLQDELAAESYPLQVWFTLPVLPSGLTASGENVVRLALAEGVNINGVNIMTMDYGDSAAPNPSGLMGEYGIAALKSLYSQLTSLYSEAGISRTSSEIWKMTGTTPMIGLNDVRTEVFDHEDAEQTLDFAIEKGVGMISMWSANRDRAQAADSLTYVSISSTGLAQPEYGFSSIFNEYNGASAYDPDVTDPDDGGTVDPDDPGPATGNTWSADTVYYGGDTVVYNGKVYKAKWWTKNNTPEGNYENVWDNPWEYVGNADNSTGDSGGSSTDTGGSTGDNTTDGGNASGSWNADTAYVAGDVVTLNNVTYKAKWWNKNFRPDTPVENAWDSPWSIVN